MLRPGTIVLLPRGEDFTAGVALGPEGQGARVRWPGGEAVLQAREVLRVTSEIASSPPPSEAALQEAVAHGDALRRLASQIDLASLWEAASLERRPLSLAELAELSFPRAGYVEVDATAIALLRDQVYFTPGKAGFESRSPRDVGAASARAEADRAARRLEEDVVALLRASLSREEPPPHVAPDRASAARRELEERLRAYALGGPEATGAGRAVSTLEAVLPDGTAPSPLHAFEAMVALGAWDEHENLDVLRLGFSESPSEAAQAQAEALRLRGLAPALEAALERRLDWRGEPCVAIDDRSTSDVDDALWARRLDDDHIEVHVVIADPAELVERGSPIDAEAKQRGASLYLPDRTLPMLPPALSDHLASLEPDQDRLALLFRFVVDGAGQSTGLRIDEAVVRLRERRTYEDVDAHFAALARGAGADPPAEGLLALAEAADRLRNARIAAGAIALRQPELKVAVRDGQVTVRCSDPDSVARGLVAEMMIAVGSATATYLRGAGVPAVYRWQPAPDEPVAFDPQRAAEPAHIFEVLQPMRRAEAAAEPLPHYGLGVDAYLQVSSPLRRYTDLLLHRQIKGFLRTGVPPLSERQLVEQFAEIELATAGFGRVEREAKRYWVLHALATGQLDPTERREALLVRAHGARWQAYLPEFGLSSLVNVGRPARIGERVQVQVRSADPRRGRLSLRVR